MDAIIGRGTLMILIAPYTKWRVRRMAKENEPLDWFITLIPAISSPRWNQRRRQGRHLVRPRRQSRPHGLHPTRLGMSEDSVYERHPRVAGKVLIVGVGAVGSALAAH